jgi:hypothetical protein
MHVCAAINTMRTRLERSRRGSHQSEGVRRYKGRKQLGCAGARDVRNDERLVRSEDIHWVEREFLRNIAASDGNRTPEPGQEFLLAGIFRVGG